MWQGSANCYSSSGDLVQHIPLGTARVGLGNFDMAISGGARKGDLIEIEISEFTDCIFSGYRNEEYTVELLSDVDECGERKKMSIQFFEEDNNSSGYVGSLSIDDLAEILEVLSL